MLARSFDIKETLRLRNAERPLFSQEALFGRRLIFEKRSASAKVAQSGKAQ